MSLFNFFKKKKKEEKEVKKEVKEKDKGPLLRPIDGSKEDKKILAKKKELKPEVSKKEKSFSPVMPTKKNLGKGYQVLESAHITEKASTLAEKNKYVFKVWPRTNKDKIKEAVESTYGVNVTGVKIINIPRRRRKLGRYKGWKKGYRKAVVEVKKGQKIEILPR